MSTPTQTYSRTARVLHWGMAILMIAMLLFGEDTMGQHDPGLLPSLHASAGFLLLALIVIRIGWRWRVAPHPLSAGSHLEKRLAHLAHFALYAAMLLLPLTGWLAYTEHVHLSKGIPPATAFGLAIPLLPDFGLNWHLAHNLLGKLTLVVIVLHVLAALKHHFLNRDDTLRRMTG